MLTIGLEQQQQIRGADGTLLWTGTGIVGVPYSAKNVSAGEYADVVASGGLNSPAALIPLGSAVLWATGAAAANTVVPRLETIRPSGGDQGWAISPDPLDQPQVLVVGCTNLNTDRVLNVNFMGVSLEPIGFGKIGALAGPGGLVTARCTAAAIAVGALVGGTTGITGANSQGGAGTTTGPLVTVAVDADRILGVCIQTNTVAAPGTGSTGHVGVVIRPR